MLLPFIAIINTPITNKIQQCINMYKVKVCTRLTPQISGYFLDHRTNILKIGSVYKKKNFRAFHSNKARNGICLMKPSLTLNLGLHEYMTAVHDQPKPLIIPLCAELPLPDISPLDLYASTRKGCDFLLESMEGSEKIARYSYIGIDPEFVITIGNTIDIKGNEPFTAIVKDPEGKTPVDQIKSILSRFCYMNVKAPRFFGGMVGYFAYDCVYSLFEKVRNEQIYNPGSTGDQEFRDHAARFMLTKDCIVFDHAERKLYIFSSPFLTYDADLKYEYEKRLSKDTGTS